MWGAPHHTHTSRRLPERQDGGPSSRGHGCSGGKSESGQTRALHTPHEDVRQGSLVLPNAPCLQFKKPKKRKRGSFLKSGFKPKHLNRSSEAASWGAPRGGTGRSRSRTSTRIHVTASFPGSSPDRPRREGQREPCGTFAGEGS